MKDVSRHFAREVVYLIICVSCYTFAHSVISRMFTFTRFSVLNLLVDLPELGKSSIHFVTCYLMWEQSICFTS